MSSTFYFTGFKSEGFKDEEGTAFKKIQVEGRHLVVCPGWMTNAIITDKSLFLEEVMEDDDRELIPTEPPLISKSPRKPLNLVQGISGRGCFCFVSSCGILVQYKFPENRWEHLSKRYFLPQPSTPPPKKALQPIQVLRPPPDSDLRFNFEQMPPDLNLEELTAASLDKNESFEQTRRAHSPVQSDDSETDLYLKLLGLLKPVKKEREKMKRRRKGLKIDWTEFETLVDYEPLIRFSKTAWGAEEHFALSLTGAVHRLPSIPRNRTQVQRASVIPMDDKVVDIACGRAHTLLLTDSGALYSFGLGSHGELGTGDLNAQEIPIEVPALKGMTVKMIAAGSWHSCAITDSGDLYSWGWNKRAQLGIPRPEGDNTQLIYAEPTLVDFPGVDSELRITQVSCGSSHTVILLSDGTLWGCGWNKYSQLGLDTREDVEKFTRIPFPSSVKIDKVTCAWWGTVILPEESDALPSPLKSPHLSKSLSLDSSLQSSAGEDSDTENTRQTPGEESDPPSEKSGRGFHFL